MQQISNLPLYLNVKYYEKHYLRTLASLEYYQQLKFVNELENLGYSIKKFKSLPGMSQEKLEIILRYWDEVKKCNKTGFKISCFAQIEEKRLLHILSNFEEAKEALKLVSCRELFGLPPKHSNFFKSHDHLEDPESSNSMLSCIVS